MLSRVHFFSFAFTPQSTVPRKKHSTNPNPVDLLPPFAGGGRLAGNGVAGSTDPSSGLEVMEPPALPDVLLEEIFLRIDAPADLARASAACVAFHRLTTDPSFLRRYRSLHPPLLLGFLDSDGHGLQFQPHDEPHPYAALSRAVARTNHFPFEDYLPRVAGFQWCLWMVRDGRALLGCHSEDGHDEEIVFPDLAVCDPLARRCLPLPPIPDDLLASVQVQKQRLDGYDVALVPSGEEDEDGTSFRVIARMDFTEKVVAFIFSSNTGCWGAGESISWDALSLPRGNLALDWNANYAYGCFYWKVTNMKRCLKLDISSMEFSTIDLLPGFDMNLFTIVEAGKGRLGIFSLNSNKTSLCYCTIRQDGGERSDRLDLGSKIPLPVDHRYIISAAYEGHIFISTYQSQLSGYQYQPTVGAPARFILEAKTLKIERVCQRLLVGHPYFGFPPSMSQRRI
ncbi:hypothetical protein BS78_08G145300 [Paspalum vaginatum]|nr:hypothetical protein BS78_08G145300 [Paspalum vaginatum]